MSALSNFRPDTGEGSEGNGLEKLCPALVASTKTKALKLAGDVPSPRAREARLLVYRCKPSARIASGVGKGGVR